MDALFVVEGEDEACVYRVMMRCRRWCEGETVRDCRCRRSAVCCWCVISQRLVHELNQDQIIKILFSCDSVST